MPSLREQYDEVRLKAAEALTDTTQRLTGLAVELNLPLVQPISGRVKTWESIESKLKRLTRLQSKPIADLQDLIGVRAIFLFSSDVARFGGRVHQAFSVVRVLPSVDRNAVDRFGYGSDHFVLRLSDGLLAELQVRTLAQHLWAEVSHQLYYKKGERRIPPELRRSMSRTSAVLEVVDFEFERLRKERDAYVRKHGDLPGFEDDEILSIIGVALVLHDMLPEDHFVEDDHYFGLMTELFNIEITTLGDLRRLIRENLASALAEERDVIEFVSQNPKIGEKAKIQIRTSDHYFSQVGLVRTMLMLKFGDRYRVFDPRKWKET